MQLIAQQCCITRLIVYYQPCNQLRQSVRGMRQWLTLCITLANTCDTMKIAGGNTHLTCDATVLCTRQVVKKLLSIFGLPRYFSASYAVWCESMLFLFYKICNLIHSLPGLNSPRYICDCSRGQQWLRGKIMEWWFTFCFTGLPSGC